MADASASCGGCGLTKIAALWPTAYDRLMDAHDEASTCHPADWRVRMGLRRVPA